MSTASSDRQDRDLAASTRIDKWLWAVRLYPTRTAATEACAAGRVRMGGEAVKAARGVGAGDVVELRDHPRVVRCLVLRVIDKRVGAPIAVTCYEVELAVERSEPLDENGEPLPPWLVDAPQARRDRGSGRPTKRDRRRIDELRGQSG